MDIRVDTHSGDLSKIDLKRQLLLMTGGKTLSPTTSVRLGGHHSGGKLFFALQRTPERFEIVIGKVGSMGELTFRWP
ncbi:MAG: hypothetical protein V3S64_02850 [bacterium]